MVFYVVALVAIGFILAGIAFYIAHTKLKEAYINPENYENIKGMKTAKIVALVVLIINILFFLRVIYVIYTIGWDEMMEPIREALEQARQG